MPACRRVTWYRTADWLECCVLHCAVRVLCVGMSRCGRRRKHIPDDTSPLALVCERRPRVIFRQKEVCGEPYTREDYILSEYSSFGISYLMICSCLVAIASYIVAPFFFVNNSVCWEGVKKDGNSNFCSEMYPHCTGRKRCSEMNPHCTMESNFQHRFSVNVLCNDLIAPFILECRLTADVFLQILQNGLTHLFK